MLNFHGVGVSFGTRRVLDQVSFALAPHKLTALVGRNGSGKSTLISCMNREISYTGTITISGNDIAQMKRRACARQIAILPQVLPAPAVRVEELVTFGRNPYLDFGKRQTDADRQIVRDAMEEIGITHLRHRLLPNLSGGEKQKAYLAMILAQQTDVAVLDEPTTYMDMEYETAFFQLLQALKEEKGMTLLVVMHNLSQAVRYADEIVVLDEGHIRFSGDTQACVNEGVLEAVFHVQKHQISEAGKSFVFFT